MTRRLLPRLAGVILAGTLLFLAPAPQTHAETIYFYHNDHLGSPLAMTDMQGNVVWRRVYQPFGQEIDPGGETASNTHKYTGKEYDPETGLYYYGARYYDPVVGRFLTVDPAGGRPEVPQTWNRYVYTLNNPYKYVDPDGKRTYVAGGIHNTNAYGPASYIETFARKLSAAGVRNVRTVAPLFNSRADRLPLGVGQLFGSGAVVLEWANLRTWSQEVIDQVAADLAANPLEPGEQVNFIGFSGGGPVLSNVIEWFKNSGVNNGRVDHFVTIGSPTGMDIIGSHVGHVGNIWSPLDPLSWKATLGPIDDYMNGLHGHMGYFRTPYEDKVIRKIKEWGVR